MGRYAQRWEKCKKISAPKCAICAIAHALTVPQVDGHDVHPGEEGEENVLEEVAHQLAGQRLLLVFCVKIDSPGYTEKNLSSVFTNKSFAS